MEPSDRRIGFRVELELFLTQFIRDRPFRVLTTNLSETGVYVHRVAQGSSARMLTAGTVVGLELELPGTGEVIWARGEVCRERSRRGVCGSGVRFADMPRVHARMVRDFCHDRRRARLTTLLGRIGHGHVPAPRRVILPG
jgi:c-di-GMP-binding flagellar brake protein YcgR